MTAPIMGPLSGPASGFIAMITNSPVIIAVKPELDPITGPLN